EKPSLSLRGDAISVEHPRLGGYRLEAAPEDDGTLPRSLFCENETNTARLYGSSPITPYPKDGINDHVVSGSSTVNPEQHGTKAAWWYHVAVPAGGRTQIRVRLHRPDEGDPRQNDRTWSV